MRLALVALALMVVPPALAGCKKTSTLTDVSDAKLKVGQRWNYWARPGEEQSTFTVERIESHPALGVIVHVGLDNLQLKQGGKTIGLLPHVVFTRVGIEKSIAKLLEEDSAMPPFMPEYSAWRKQFDETGSAPFFNSSVAEALNTMEQSPDAPAK